MRYRCKLLNVWCKNTITTKTNLNNRVKPEDVQRMAKWNLTTVWRMYNVDFPTGAVTGRSGFKQDESLIIPRGHHSPPPDLVEYLIPDVIEWKKIRRASFDGQTSELVAGDLEIEICDGDTRYLLPVKKLNKKQLQAALKERGISYRGNDLKDRLLTSLLLYMSSDK